MNLRLIKRYCKHNNYTKIYYAVDIYDGKSTYLKYIITL